MMFRALLVTAMLIPAMASAQSKRTPKAPPPPPPNLRELAIQETQLSGVQSNKASEVEVGKTGYLTLEDPGLSKEVSPWKWTVAFRLQSLAPQGTAEMRNGQQVNLDDTGSMTLPFLEVGSLYQLQPSERGAWSVGASIEGGTSVRKTSVTFPSGIEAPNTRLSTNFLGGSILGTYRHPKAAKWEALLGWTEGVVTYSQSSDNDGANFSKSARYGGWRLGLGYEASRNWLIGLEQSQRSVRSGDGIDLPEHNTSFSTRVTW